MDEGQLAEIEALARSGKDRNLPATRETGASGLAKRAGRIARQRLPSLPTRGDVIEGIVAVTALGVGALVLWHWIGWIFVIPLLLVKAGIVGAGLVGAWWILSRLLPSGGDETPEDE